LKAKKLLYLKEKEIKNKNNSDLQTWLKKIMKEQNDEEAEKFLDSVLNSSRELTIPDYFCCKITYVLIYKLKFIYLFFND
jgi:hypothetical protein